MEQGEHEHSLFSSPFIGIFQGLHWATLCQAGAIHDDGEDLAEVQDGVQWEEGWDCD